ncbi:unnamed protein product [Brachionus calyciflorus]|uniref:Integrase zinc-binding domain-containing protein n=1 Tax=Brachionus calyciflorus TaxID=104777 RepID=A0A814NMN7_9BILA|nr:unnamed protein product [Brachionus calyciflorus]
MNKALRRTRYPTRSIEDLIYTVNGAVKFSKANIRKAFHQLKIALASRRHTTITTPRCLFRYKRLHMGISSASEEFTELIRKILEGIPMQLNMTDYVLVFDMTDEEHDRNLLLEEHGIILNMEKCEFGKRELTFFGLRLLANGIAQTENRCQALREAPPPSNNTEWNWIEEYNLALSKIKDSISNKFMAFFDKKWNTELTVDASPVGLGSVLKLITDYRLVQLIFNNSAIRPPARKERWALRPTEFEFEILHRPGICNIADYFSNWRSTNGLLLRGYRIIVPKSLQSRVIELAHQGHQGIVKTKSLIISKVWFVGIDQAVEESLRNCGTCQVTVFAPLMSMKLQ